MNLWVRDLGLYAGFAGFILWSIVERAFTLSHQQQDSDRRSERFSYGLISFFWYGTVFYALLDAWNLNWSLFPDSLWELQLLGILLTAAGLIMRFLARRTLGRHYSVKVETSPAHRLVNEGIYGYLRHPAYLGLICLLPGIALCEGSWGALLLAGVGGLPAILYRIQIEEKALLEWFGEDYRTYSKHTWRLIPYIW
ncbi:MAG: isoprenylcysteine carboxylmethyltransferase family protein [Anaerolineae bacterium]|nr:isoprenylcysteine carboxylmethyltransferase family protein [Anaerolineae bacterium]